jgi:hypothetical protein
MTNVYLLSTDADAASIIRTSTTLTGLVALHGCAWLVPWPYGFASLQARIRYLLPDAHARVVIAEITDCAAI